jgi:hypothetical protein
MKPNFYKIFKDRLFEAEEEDGHLFKQILHNT